MVSPAPTTTSGPWFWTLSTRLHFPTAHISNVLMSGEERAGPGLGDLEKELNCSVCAHDLRFGPRGVERRIPEESDMSLAWMWFCLLDLLILCMITFSDKIKENMHEEKKTE